MKAGPPSLPLLLPLPPSEVDPVSPELPHAASATPTHAIDATTRRDRTKKENIFILRQVGRFTTTPQ
jgi:hypothetical protein